RSSFSEFIALSNVHSIFPFFSGLVILQDYRSLIKKIINLQPIHKSIKPSITGSVRIAQAESMAPILIKVKLHRYACFVPGIHHTELSSKKEIICCDYIEHSRSILGNFHWTHPAIYRADKGQFH